MTSNRDITTALQRLLTAYERLGATRRRALGLNPNEEAALLLIGQGVTAPSELSRTIGMTTAGVTNMLDRLEGDGLLRREPHETDKRRVLLTLTKKGFRAQLEVEAVMSDVALIATDAGEESAASILAFLDAAAAHVDASADRTS